MSELLVIYKRELQQTWFDRRLFHLAYLFFWNNCKRLATSHDEVDARQCSIMPARAAECVARRQACDRKSVRCIFRPKQGLFLETVMSAEKGGTGRWHPQFQPETLAAAQPVDLQVHLNKTVFWVCACVRIQGICTECFQYECKHNYPLLGISL